jgi:SAM-dependent methyltransferase
MLCRSCGAATTPVLSLGEMPLANHLLSHPMHPCARYPLDLEFCPECKLGQLAEIVQPPLMFTDYPYYSSVSAPTVTAANDLALDVCSQLGTGKLDKESLVVEVGSNDGYLLSAYKNYGIPVLGIDPASGPANAAALKGIPTVQDFFGLSLAKRMPKADVIHAHNVLAHVPDLNDFVAGIAEMLKPDGMVVVEAPYLGDLVDKCAFDTIYAEHDYYFSVTAAMQLFLRHGMLMNSAKRIPAHGGSLRLCFSKKLVTGMTWPKESFDFSEMAGRMKSIACGLQDFLVYAHSRHKRVWGFGAAAKATVMLNYCGIDTTLIESIADGTPAKIGKYIPGTGIRIAHPQDWLEAQPDYTCIFAWNYANEICHRYAKDYRGIMFTPYITPSVEVSA